MPGGGGPAAIEDLLSPLIASCLLAVITYCQACVGTPHAYQGACWCGWHADVCEHIERASPHSHSPGWALSSVIVKSGDDCRQEQLALQLIAVFRDIWAGAG